MPRSQYSLLTAAVAMVFTLLSACGNGPRFTPPPADEQLITEITADGTKFFVLERDYLRPQAVDPGAPPGRRGERPAADRNMAERNIEQRLTLIMERTGYCREGFFELYRQQTLRGFSVRGECREDASDADREQFAAGPISL